MDYDKLKDKFGTVGLDMTIAEIETTLKDVIETAGSPRLQARAKNALSLVEQIQRCS